MGRRSTWLTWQVRNWLEKAERELTVKRCGGDQRCPWCRQWMNQWTTTQVNPFADGMMDEIRCGHCFGTSVWKWEVGFIFITAGEPPTSCLQKSDFGDSPFLWEQVRFVRATYAGRLARRATVRDDVGWLLGPPPAESDDAVAAAQRGAQAISATDQTLLPQHQHSDGEGS